MEDLEKYFPKDKKNVFEAAGYMASNEQLKMIDELAGEVLKVISFGMQLLPEPVKKVLENRVVQGLTKTSGGLTQIAAGCELCTTVVGSVQGIPMIALGTNMAFEGLQDLWYTLNGELDKESKNLIKEATGHKIDNIVELSEIGMSIYAGKVSSKKIAGKIGEESEKLGGLLKKIKKPVSSLSAKSKRLVKKFLPKRHYRRFEVVDIEELARKQGLKPNLQLFAEEGKENVIVKLANRGISLGRHDPKNLFEQIAMKEVMSNPLEKAIDLSKISKPILLNDKRWPCSEGWVKMQRVVVGSNGEKVTIHFVYNDILKLFDDFKFV
jgi:hypothetical protein